MKNSFYPVLMCDDIRKEADFFIKLFDFKEVFHSEWYISLKDNEGFELAMITSSHDTIPQQYQKQCAGIILNIEVDDVDSVYSKVISKDNISLLLEIQDEDYGQRHFMIETPNKILVDIIQMIPVVNEYQDRGDNNDQE